jgi:uncharacterized membrane protein YqjE
MADSIQTPTDPGATPAVAPLVSGIVEDLQELLKQNLALFKVEVKEDLKKTKQAAGALGVGVGLAGVGALHLTVMLVYLLFWAFDPNLPLWACFGIVGGLFAAIGGALFLKGKRKLASFNPLPDESAQALKENVQWLTNTNTPK